MSTNQKISILIVEDDASIAELVKGLLNDELNYHAVVVNNGALAIELLKDIKINLLILDIGLPGVNGLQIYDWLLAQHKLDYLPVMFMTAQSTQYQRDLERRGIRNIVHKPFDLDEFLDVVHQSLSSSSVDQKSAEKFKMAMLEGHNNKLRSSLQRS